MGFKSIKEWAVKSKTALEGIIKKGSNYLNPGKQITG